MRATWSFAWQRHGKLNTMHRHTPPPLHTTNVVGQEGRSKWTRSPSEALAGMDGMRKPQSLAMPGADPGSRRPKVVLGAVMPQRPLGP